MSDSVGNVPYAPIDLSPNGEWRVDGSKTRLSWSYQGTGGDTQTKFEVQYRVNQSGDEWKVVSGGTNQFVDLSPEPGVTELEWQVRTWGSSADPSEWSSSAKVYYEPKPVLTISGLENVEGSNSATAIFKLNMVKSFYWEAELSEAGVLVGSASGRTGVDEDGSWQLTGLRNGVTYLLRARARSYVESDWVSRTFTVSYAAPAAPKATQAVWDPEQGAVSLRWNVSATGDPAPVSVEVYRVLEDGSRRRIGRRTLPLNGTFVDYGAVGNGINNYAIVTVSKLGAKAETLVSVDTSRNPLKDVFITSNDGEIRIRSRFDPAVDFQVGKHNVFNHYFLGRDRPVMFAGKHTARTVSYKGVIIEEEAKELLPAFEKLAVYPKPVIYRDPAGSLLWLSVESVSVSKSHEMGSWDVSFTGVEVVDVHSD